MPTPPTGKPTLLIIGAGATGRGQIGQLAWESGWHLVFLDRDRALIEALRAAGRYTVRLFQMNGAHRDVTIRDFETVHTSETDAAAAAVACADLVVTSVIATNLSQVAPVLAAGLQRRAAAKAALVNVIAAENMERSSSVLRELVLEALPNWTPARLEPVARFPDSMIARVVPIPTDPLLIPTLEYSEWTVDRTVYSGPPPRIQSLELVSNQSARLQRKLFMHNTGHATCAYWARLRGCRYVHEGGTDPAILREVDAAVSESGAAVAAEHGFPRQEILAYQQVLLDAVRCSVFADSLDRVCREPLRKLGPRERFLGPIGLCVRHNLPITHLCRAVAVVLRTSGRSDPQYADMQAQLRRAGPESVLREACGLTAAHPAWDRILAEYERLGRSAAAEDTP